MIHWHKLGTTPAKPHTAFYEGEKLLMEQMITREGFHGPFSTLYYRTPPTDESRVEPCAMPGFCPVQCIERQPLHRRHIRSQDLAAEGDFLSSRRTLLVNSNLQVGVCKPNEPARRRFFSNGDGDELYFVTRGSGRLESVFGVLPFREHDYLLVPKGTAYRLHFNGNAGTLLVFEGRPALGVPSDYRNNWGQLSEYAPYSHRDFRVPQELMKFDRAVHGEPPYEVLVKVGDQLTLHQYPLFPLEVAGWDGFLYPVAFNIHDYQSKTGLIHLPPTIHTTFAGPGFVVCSFVPRKVDYHPQAIPCPYAHSSVDMDEILYYVEGSFTSRKGIQSESISLHPQGVTHGPHPGTYEASIGHDRTEELAVMCDAYSPFRLTALAERIEDKGYHTSWVQIE
jgi:homogentisate 1,2-dioxygenase